jgi:hypothetical protein
MRYGRLFVATVQAAELRSATFDPAEGPVCCDQIIARLLLISSPRGACGLLRTFMNTLQFRAICGRDMIRKSGYCPKQAAFRAACPRLPRKEAIEIPRVS